MGRTTSENLELLMEAAALSEPHPAGSGTHMCDQLLALAEAASQRSKEEAHLSNPLPHVRVTHQQHSSKDEPGSTGRYAGHITPSIGHHSSSGSPAMGSLGAINSNRHAAANARTERARGRAVQRNKSAAAVRGSASPQQHGGEQGSKRQRKYASNVPRMGRIAWIDNRHTDQKLRSRYAGVTQYQQTPLWKARISCALQKQIHLGVYADEEEAARCYDRAAYQFKGERAVFNIPDYNYAHDPFILSYQHLDDKDFIAQLRTRATDLLRRAALGIHAPDEHPDMVPPPPSLTAPNSHTINGHPPGASVSPQASAGHHMPPMVGMVGMPGMAKIVSEMPLGAPPYMASIIPPPAAHGPAMMSPKHTRQGSFDPAILFVGTKRQRAHMEEAYPQPLVFDPAKPLHEDQARRKQQRRRTHKPLHPTMQQVPLDGVAGGVGMVPVDRATAWSNVLMSVMTAYVSTAAAIVPMVLQSRE